MKEKDFKISLRLTKQEKDWLLNEAAKSDLSLTSYIKSNLFIPSLNQTMNKSSKFERRVSEILVRLYFISKIKSDKELSDLEKENCRHLTNQLLEQWGLEQ